MHQAITDALPSQSIALQEQTPKSESHWNCLDYLPIHNMTAQAQRPAAASPESFIMLPSEVKALAHKGEKDGRVSYWLQPKA
jgi:hypothetical protein